MTPTALTPIEIENWLWAYGSQPKVKNYLATGTPPWGITVDVEGWTGSGSTETFLLFIPTLGGEADPKNLHIVLVTGHPIVEEVNKAPYKSPDDVGFWENLQKQINDTLAGAATAGKYILVGLGLLVALQLLRK